MSERESGPRGGPWTGAAPELDAVRAGAGAWPRCRRTRAPSAAGRSRRARARHSSRARRSRAPEPSLPRLSEPISKWAGSMSGVPACRRLASRDHPGGFRAWAQIHPAPPRATLDYASPEACFGIQPGRNAGTWSSGVKRGPSTPQCARRGTARASRSNPAGRAKDPAAGRRGASVGTATRRGRRRAHKARARGGSGRAQAQLGSQRSRRRDLVLQDQERRSHACGAGGCARRRAASGASWSSRRGRSAPSASASRQAAASGWTDPVEVREPQLGNAPVERAEAATARPRRSRRSTRFGMTPGSKPRSRKSCTARRPRSPSRWSCRSPTSRRSGRRRPGPCRARSSWRTRAPAAGARASASPSRARAG